MADQVITADQPVQPPDTHTPPSAGYPITIEVRVRLQAIALPEEGGRYSVLIPALGCATVGDTIEEVQANAVEAAEGLLASLHDRNKDRDIRIARGEE
jgi:predicted RNase H-like HicB family nuclease